MYYRNDYNSPHEPWEQPIETTGHVVEEPGHKEPKKKKSFGGKIVALCLVCALVGGVAGGAGVAAFSGNQQRRLHHPGGGRADPPLWSMYPTSPPRTP